MCRAKKLCGPIRWEVRIRVLQLNLSFIPAVFRSIFAMRGEDVVFKESCSALFYPSQKRGGYRREI